MPSFKRLIAQVHGAPADGYLMLTVPAHHVRPGDIIGGIGGWCTVHANDDSTTGETSTRSILLADNADGSLRTLGILAVENVAVLRAAENARESR